MILLNTTRYGLIACRYLTWGYYHNEWLSAPQIADHYGMNVRALTPALHTLHREGLLLAHRGGANPGFFFSRDPAGINMLDVVVALEGPSEFTCCRQHIPSLKCGCNTEDCTACTSFNAMFALMKSHLESISLKDHALEEYDNIEPQI